MKLNVIIMIVCLGINILCFFLNLKRLEDVIVYQGKSPSFRNIFPIAFSTIGIIVPMLYFLMLN